MRGEYSVAGDGTALQRMYSIDRRLQRSMRTDRSIESRGGQVRYREQTRVLLPLQRQDGMFRRAILFTGQATLLLSDGAITLGD